MREPLIAHRDNTGEATIAAVPRLCKQSQPHWDRQEPDHPVNQRIKLCVVVVGRLEPFALNGATPLQEVHLGEMVFRQ